ncbi:MAG TPA: hypothetical protein VD970_17335 [Acetobacteraceae bacterium]|nr:hypothetical protein [Acetobacteraceae bacterium]
MTLLALLLLTLALPMPTGLLLGAAIITGGPAPAQQAPPPASPQPDCNCGVPDSPRGPR